MENNGAYRETFRIRAYEADLKNKVKINSIFNYMQEIASVDAERRNFGYGNMEAAGLFWVLSRAKIYIYDQLSAWEDLTVETWPKNIVKLFANRDFRFYNSKEECIGTATTAWLMLNKNNFRPQNPELHLAERELPPLPPAVDEFPDKIPDPDEKQHCFDFKLGYKDIDLNLHTNNTRYIEYMTDCFEENFTAGYQIRSMQINFLNQTRSGDVLSLYKSINSEDTSASYAEAVNQNNIKVFNAIINWSK